MFKDSKYTRIYFRIIERRKAIGYDGYTEKHHIIPKCLGGNDDTFNIVRLTAREHFICHLLLSKMSNSSKLKFALHMMTLNNGRQQRGYKITSGVYEYIKLKNSEAARERNLNRDYSFFNGRKLYHNVDGKHKLIDPHYEDVGNWFEGMSTKRRNTIGKSNKGKVYYHKDGHVIAISKDDVPPVGYIKGNPNADTSAVNGIKGSSYFYNPISGEEKRCKDCPDGWVKGRSVCWITDGLINKHLNKVTDQLPDGWKFGKVNWRGKDGM